MRKVLLVTVFMLACSVVVGHTTRTKRLPPMTSQGVKQLKVGLTPSVDGLYRVDVTETITTAGVGCTTQGSAYAYISWTSSMTGLPAADESIANLTGASVLGQEVTYHFLVDAKGGYPISEGINVVIAAAGCSTFPVIATKMEELP